MYLHCKPFPQLNGHSLNQRPNIKLLPLVEAQHFFYSITINHGLYDWLTSPPKTQGAASLHCSSAAEHYRDKSGVKGQTLLLPAPGAASTTLWDWTNKPPDAFLLSFLLLRQCPTLTAILKQGPLLPILSECRWARPDVVCCRRVMGCRPWWLKAFCSTYYEVQHRNRVQTQHCLSLPSASAPSLSSSPSPTPPKKKKKVTLGTMCHVSLRQLPWQALQQLKLKELEYLPRSLSPVPQVCKWPLTSCSVAAHSSMAMYWNCRSFSVQK